jgi:hypothetical protein
MLRGTSAGNASFVYSAMYARLFHSLLSKPLHTALIPTVALTDTKPGTMARLDTTQLPMEDIMELLVTIKPATALMEMLERMPAQVLLHTILMALPLRMTLTALLLPIPAQKQPPVS